MQPAARSCTSAVRERAGALDKSGIVPRRSSVAAEIGQIISHYGQWLGRWCGCCRCRWWPSQPARAGAPPRLRWTS
eukprot:877144-Pyramimonas_sp.AAC.1